MSARDVALDALWTEMEKLGADEIRVIAYQAYKMRLGCEKYGALTLATDTRNWDRELAEEESDAEHYRSMKVIHRAIVSGALTVA